MAPIFAYSAEEEGCDGVLEEVACQTKYFGEDFRWQLGDGGQFVHSPLDTGFVRYEFLYHVLDKGHLGLKLCYRTLKKHRLEGMLVIRTLGELTSMGRSWCKTQWYAVAFSEEHSGQHIVWYVNTLQVERIVCLLQQGSGTYAWHLHVCRMPSTCFIGRDRVNSR